MTVARLSSLATEYVKVPVRLRIDGGFVDPTGDTVTFAFMPAREEPEDGDWVSGSWETDNSRYYAQVLTGPAGAVNPGDGTWFLWIKVVHSPETLVRNAGTVVIT